MIDVCDAHHIPCTAHLELLDARELIAAGLHGIEHVTSLGTSVVPRTSSAKRTGRRCSPTTTRGATVDTSCSRDADLDGPEAQALYAVLRARKPWLDPTLAVFERRADRRRRRAPSPRWCHVHVAGFAKMKQLARRAGLEGARLVMGGHSTVPFAARGEAPWRELELLVESGFTPLEAITAATGTAAAFLYRDADLGTLRPGGRRIWWCSAAIQSGISAIRTVERVMAAGRWVDVARYRQVPEPRAKRQLGRGLSP